MSVLSSIKPPMWPISPALTEAPELWRDAFLVFPFWEQGPKAFSYGENKSAVDFGSNGVVRTTPVGTGINNNGAKATISGVMSGIMNSNFAVVFYWDDFQSNSFDDCQIAFSGADDCNMYCWERIFWRDLGGTIMDWNNDTSRQVWALNSSSPTDHRAYKNGVELDKTTNNRNNSSGTSDLQFAHFNGSQECNQTHLFLGIWKRALTLDEISVLSNDPFAMLRPRSDL